MLRTSLGSARATTWSRRKAAEYYPGTEEAHTNPTRQRGEWVRALAGALGSVCARMRNFLAGVIAHSCREAERILGYIAPVPYREAMDLTASWLLFARLI